MPQDDNPHVLLTKSAWLPLATGAITFAVSNGFLALTDQESTALAGALAWLMSLAVRRMTARPARWSTKRKDSQ